MIRCAKIGILALVFCLTGTSTQANSFGAAVNYNGFVFDDFSASNSNTEGRLAAGGNVTLQNYGVGNKLPANSGNVLVAGGDLTFTNGQIYNGNAVVGGSATLSGVGVPNGGVTSGAAVPVNFSKERDYLTRLSNSLSQMPATGTISSPWSGALLFQGDNSSDLQVFNVNGSELSSANTFRFLDDTPMIPAGATLVFNISGSSASMGNFDMQGFKNLLGESWDKVLFNFYEAGTLKLGSIGIYGSILAPLADITTSSGQINGTVVANSWNGPMHLINRPFNGVVWPAPTVSLSANPPTVKFGESTTLSWQTTDAETVTIEPGIGEVELNGSISVTLYEKTTYTITATGPGGTATDSVEVDVTDIPPPGIYYEYDELGRMKRIIRMPASQSP